MYSVGRMEQQTNQQMDGWMKNTKAFMIRAHAVLKTVNDSSHRSALKIDQRTVEPTGSNFSVPP